MAPIEIALTLLLAVLASGYIARALPIALPLPLVQIALGAVIAGLLGHGITLEPQVFFLLFLPPLLFLDGWRIPKDALKRDRPAIVHLAFGLVVFTVIGAGFLIHALIPQMPLPVAFALAAVLSPTDPVAVTSIAARTSFPPRAMRILEGEALLNDASGLVAFRFAVAAAVTGAFSLSQAAMTFAYVAVVGIAAGVLVTIGGGRLRSFVARRLGEEAGAPVLLSLLLPFGAYLAAEALHASGILAAVGAGIAMSRIELSGTALPSTRVHRAAVWDTVQFALNGIMFVLLGEQLPRAFQSGVGGNGNVIGALDLSARALAIAAGLVLLRFAWVWVSLAIARRIRRDHWDKMPAPRLRMVAAMSVAGVRGAITMAAVMTLPLAMPDGTPFPARDIAIFVAGAVILISLVLASAALPPLLRDLPAAPDDRHHREEDLAQREAGAAAIAAIERELARRAEQPGADVRSDAAARVVALYRRSQGQAQSEDDASRFREGEAAEHGFRLVGLRAERARIYELAREDRLSDETARELVRGLDLAEARYRQELG